jgi:hypothetical protein
MPSSPGAEMNSVNYFCGIVENYTLPDSGNIPTNKTVWQGVCIQGVCKECNSILLLGSATDITMNAYGGALTSQFGNKQTSAPKLHCVSSNAPTGDDNPATDADPLGYGPPRYCKNFAFTAPPNALVGLSSAGRSVNVVLGLQMLLGLAAVYFVAV